MNQFDVCLLKGDSSGSAFVVILQHDALSQAGTVVVAPLLPLAKFKPSPRLHPLMEIEGRPYMIGTELLFAIERKRIGATVDSAVGSMDRIKNALDILFVGF